MSMWMILRTDASNYTIRGCATSRVRSAAGGSQRSRGIGFKMRTLPLFRVGPRSCHRELTPSFPKTAGDNTDSGLFGDALERDAGVSRRPSRTSPNSWRAQWASRRKYTEQGDVGPIVGGQRNSQSEIQRQKLCVGLLVRVGAATLPIGECP